MSDNQKPNHQEEMKKAFLKNLRINKNRIWDSFKSDPFTPEEEIIWKKDVDFANLITAMSKSGEVVETLERLNYLMYFLDTHDWDDNAEWNTNWQVAKTEFNFNKNRLEIYCKSYTLIEDTLDNIKIKNIINIVIPQHVAQKNRKFSIRELDSYVKTAYSDNPLPVDGYNAFINSFKKIPYV